MGTFYIVEDEEEGRKEWKAHRCGFLSEVLNCYNIENYVMGTLSLRNADHCEDKLRRVLRSDEVKPKVVRVVKIVKGE